MSGIKRGSHLCKHADHKNVDHKREREHQYVLHAHVPESVKCVDMHEREGNSKLPNPQANTPGKEGERQESEREGQEGDYAPNPHPHAHSSSMLIFASLLLSLGRALTMELWKKMLYGITRAPATQCSWRCRL